MPNRPKKIKRGWKPERKPFERENSDYKFYNSSRWRKVAKNHRSKSPLCVKCLDDGITKEATVTDHIQRLKDGGLPYSNDNLQSLCAFHHNQKSGLESHGYKEGYGVKTPENGG